MEPTANTAQFRDQNGRSFQGLSWAQVEQLHQQLSSEFSVQPIQVCEAASFSMAMVVRSALGLSAAEGQVAVAADDCIETQVALAAARHLTNAGAKVTIVSFQALSSEDTLAQLRILRSLGAQEVEWKTLQQQGQQESFFESQHNIICAFRPGTQTPDQAVFVDAVNEHSIPVHCVRIPPGLNPDTGAREGTSLFASSTLSLGVPLQALIECSDYVGRHYICDISIPQSLYERSGARLEGLFSDQPVLQIFSGDQG